MAASAVVKLKLWSPAIASGGSVVSWSVTCEATTVTVHDSLLAKFVSGSMVKPTGPPVTVAVWAPLELHAIVYQPSVTVTGSLKLTVTLAPTPTFESPSDGVVLCTVGASSVGFDVPVTAMSSMPTHSSLPTALVVMILSWMRLVLGGCRQLHGDGGDLRCRIGGRGVRNERGRYVGEVAGAADPVVQGYLLRGVVHRGVQIAQPVPDLHARVVQGLDVDQDERRISRARPFNAIVGSASSNSATPPVVKVVGWSG